MNLNEPQVYTWKYLEHTPNKHAFYRSDAIMAICGSSPHWTTNFKWQGDAYGLKKRKECGRCKRIQKD